MSPTKQRFLKATAELLRKQGYSGTGLKEVAAAADAPWGSMYHFFPRGKEQLASESILHSAEGYRKAFEVLFDRVADPIKAVKRIFEHEVEVLKASDYRDGCPLASTAVDVASTLDPVRAACSDGFAAWEREIDRMLRRKGLTPRESRRMASFILSSLEGAIILSRTHRSPEPLRSAGEMTAAALEARLSAAGARSPKGRKIARNVRRAV